MPEAIFRRLDEPADEEYLSKVEPVVEMNSSDSSNTGTITAVSERTTITVHRTKKPDQNLPDLVPEETPTEQTPGETTATGDASPRPTMAKCEDHSSSSNRTTLTSPVTPDTSIDGGNDGSLASVKLESAETKGQTTTSFKPHADDDKADKEDDRDIGGKEDERDMKTPSPVQSSRSQTETRSSSGRQSYGSGTERPRVARRRVGSGGRRSLRDDESSSDDDSSYFASHLPDPKSVRSFSISSAASNASAFSNTYQKQVSDASLSFSDESDEGQHHGPGKSQLGGAGVHLSPVINPKMSVADMNLYPQRITRMHSVSSLVSSASSDNRVGGEDFGDGEPNRRRSFTGDDSITSSLPSIASTGPEAMRGLDTSGGYYVSGAAVSHQMHHNYHPQSYLSPQQSPDMPYYSTQPMTNQQMMAWATTPSDGEFEYTSSEYTTSSRNNSLDPYPHHRSQFSQSTYGASPTIEQPASKMMSSSGRGIASASSGSLNFAFSDDEDTPAGRGKRTVGKQAAGATGTGRSGGPGSGGDVPQRRREGNLGSGSRQKGVGGGGPTAKPTAAATGSADDGLVAVPGGGEGGGRQTFEIYWQRWIMLFYMSVLNLLSDWTCYSVAPISLLTEEAFGSINPEQLVVVFLGANAVASACEPMILARLGLRRTVLLGSLLLMIGSIIKSGGLPPIMEPTLDIGHAQWNLYLGFFIVGLSQPLYQCTPALLSASWFPEEERTMATGVALNANQLGIGFAFIFGTLLVSTAKDIIPYFGLLSQVSILCFIGTLIQFDDAPPTPPSASARVMKGNLNFTMPNFRAIAVRRFSKTDAARSPTPASSAPGNKAKSKRKGKKASRSSPGSGGGKRGGSSTRRRGLQTANSENGLFAPSSAHYGSTEDAMREIARTKDEAALILPRSLAPSPAPAETEGGNSGGGRDESNPDAAAQMGGPPGGFPPGQMPGYYGYPYPPPPPNYQYFQQMQQQAYFQQQMYHQQQLQQPMAAEAGQPQPPMMGQGVPPMPPPPQMQYFPPPQPMAMPYPYQQQLYARPDLYRTSSYSDAYDIDAYGDEGAEPVVTVTNHHLDIDIRDDQVVRSLHACMIRQGFSHALAAFTVSGIVINTLSTYMDYLVRLNGAPRSYTGIVGGTFQFAIMMSSLIMGKQTDKTRAYYSVTTGMLVLGAFGLAECGVSLDSNRGTDLRWSLLLVAVLVGPLQPISTELGVEVAYPLSENTVLVIQQLFSNLLSALFIPFFKSLKDIGTTVVSGDEMIERPEYTFSFYLLIVLHTMVTVYFATFNGRYLRYEHELQKKEEEEAAERDAEEGRMLAGEFSPLLNPNATAAGVVR